MEVHISKNQAKELARAIKNDIFEYIEKHKEEYQEFLKIEAKKLDLLANL